MNKPTLKPCPFCGGEAHLQGEWWPRFVKCTVCGAEVKSIQVGDPGVSEAIAKWNRRR